MWMLDNWQLLVALAAFIASWADIRTSVVRLTAQVAIQNGRLTKAELDLAEARGRRAARESHHAGHAK